MDAAEWIGVFKVRSWGLGVGGWGGKGAMNGSRVYRNLCMRYTREDWRHVSAHPSHSFDGYSTNLL